MWKDTDKDQETEESKLVFGRDRGLPKKKKKSKTRKQTSQERTSQCYWNRQETILQ